MFLLAPKKYENSKFGVFNLLKNGPNLNLDNLQTSGDVSHDLFKHDYHYNSIPGCCEAKLNLPDPPVEKNQDTS